MSAILKLVQGTKKWHDHRAQSRNASETPAVLGVSPWQTPYQLWCIRTGRVEQEVTAPMRRGSELEPAARTAYEAQTGLVMEPLVLADGDYSASLDGITFAGDLILEIKCPYKGKASELWQSVSAGEFPEHYWWQVQHQLMVSKAGAAEVFVYDGREGILHTVAPKPEVWCRIHDAWDAFAHFLSTDTPPPLMEKDVLIRDDAGWKTAAEAYVAAKAAVDGAAVLLDAAKEKLVALVGHTSEQGHGVTVTRFWKAGAVEYKKIAELKGVDLERYRGTSKQEVRITLSKI